MDYLPANIGFEPDVLVRTRDKTDLPTHAVILKLHTRLDVPGPGSVILEPFASYSEEVVRSTLRLLYQGGCGNRAAYQCSSAEAAMDTIRLARAAGIERHIFEPACAVLAGSFVDDVWLETAAFARECGLFDVAARALGTFAARLAEEERDAEDVVYMDGLFRGTGRDHNPLTAGDDDLSRPFGQTIRLVATYAARRGRMMPAFSHHEAMREMGLAADLPHPPGPVLPTYYTVLNTTRDGMQRFRFRNGTYAFDATFCANAEESSFSGAIVCVAPNAAAADIEIGLVPRRCMSSPGKCAGGHGNASGTCVQGAEVKVPGVCTLETGDEFVRSEFVIVRIRIREIIPDPGPVRDLKTTTEDLIEWFPRLFPGMVRGYVHPRHWNNDPANPDPGYLFREWPEDPY